MNTTKVEDLVTEVADDVPQRGPSESKIIKPTQNDESFGTFNSTLDDPTSKPSDHLCPFVGYHGAYCPTKHTGRPDTAQNGGRRSLPRGVGITIDVTTGELFVNFLCAVFFL